MAGKSPKTVKNCVSKGGNAKDRIHILLVGEFQNGKSTLADFLFPEGEFIIGEGWKPTTQTLQEAISRCRSISVWDSPGANAQADHNSEQTTALRFADLVLYVKIPDLDFSQSETRFMSLIQSIGLPLILVFNCRAEANSSSALPADPISAERNEIAHSMLYKLTNSMIVPLRVFFVNLAWSSLERTRHHSLNKKAKRIERSYLEHYPEDDRVEEIYIKSGFEELRRFLLTPSPSIFDEGGILSSAILGRIQKCIASIGIENE